MKSTLFLFVAAIIALSAATADELRLDGEQLFERSVTRDVRLSDDGAAIELERGELFEDDGPAAGYSYRPNEEHLSDQVWIKKELVIPNPAASAATLLVAPGGDKLSATVNGQAVELKSAGRAGKYWQTYSLPPELLKAGKSEIVLSGSGKIWIARAEDFASGSSDRTTHPNRSAKSVDAGKSWNDDRLGPNGDIDGEYYVRLHLDHVRPTGSLLLNVMDAGNLAGRDIAPPLAKPIPIRVHLDVEGAQPELSIRSGTSAAADPKTWSDWQHLESGEELRNPEGRFFQLALKLASSAGLKSPRLKGLRVEANPPKSADWSSKLKVIESENAEIVRTSIPFTYEPLDHPRLKELRTRHKLDEVVKGTKTELELIERLAVWSASRWERGHLSDAYPAWDALEILKTHTDGQAVGGFCQQYNVVFLQACESFGIHGRAVSISVGDHGGKVPGSGHEVVELWSNQFQKWMYVDGNMAWYAVDAERTEPLSLWELRDRQLQVLKGNQGKPTRIVHLLKDGKRWEGLAAWPAFLELRLIPRSNFLERTAPLPLNQGMRGWFWTGHYVWSDAEYPASLLYGNRVSDRRNWNWTLNQTRYTLEATSVPGELRVHLDTHTPGFDTFLADIDKAGRKPVASTFTWKLHSGTNQLELLTRNIAGREGKPSRVVISMD